MSPVYAIHAVFNALAALAAGVWGALTASEQRVEYADPPGAALSHAVILVAGISTVCLLALVAAV
jgi:hypothetical protein